MAIAGILAGANRMPWRHFLVASAFGIFLWSALFGVAAYSFGKQFAHLAASWWFLSGPSGWVLFAIAAAILLILLANFLGRHEAQLAAKAERALPGPLRLP
jgi:membrane protein DedA with SNARE-associated domain